MHRFRLVMSVADLFWKAYVPTFMLGARAISFAFVPWRRPSQNKTIETRLSAIAEASVCEW